MQRVQAGEVAGNRLAPISTPDTGDTRDEPGLGDGEGFDAGDRIGKCGALSSRSARLTPFMQHNLTPELIRSNQTPATPAQPKLRFAPMRNCQGYRLMPPREKASVPATVS